MAAKPLDPDIAEQAVAAPEVWDIHCRMFRRTFDAVDQATRLYGKAGTECRASLAQYEELAVSILKMDSIYADWIADYAKSHGIDSALAEAVVKAIGSRLYGNPEFLGSAGEEAVSIFLKERGIRFTREKQFSDLRHIGALRFDFFLDDLNVAVEYNGMQHYRSIGLFGGDEGFKSVRVRDGIKRAWCVQNDVRLIEIKYDQDPYVELARALNG